MKNLLIAIALVLIVPSAFAQSVDLGSTISSGGGGGSGANTTLSNLTSPVAVNQNFDPDTAFSREMGASTPWEGILMNDLTVINTLETAAFDITITDNPSTFGFLTDVYGFWQAEGGSTAITTNPGGGIILFSGNVTSGPGASGDVVLQVGTSTGTVGNIRLITGATASVAGQVWTATDTNGAGHWALPKIQVQAPSASPTCNAGLDGTLTLASSYILCVCKGGSSAWVKTSDGSTACTF